jgi:hypothetical protein
MKRVCVIIPYFGRWPEYLSLFLDGCRRNPMLHFLFLTDLRAPDQVPDNVQFRYCTIGQINESVKNLLGFESKMSRPYKLCDYKPAYGLIFQEYIRDFDYWGYGDIDVVYGDLRKWLTPEVLSHDVISFRKKWLSGSLTLIRNAAALNQLFLESPDVKKVFESPDHFEFDEVSKCWSQIRTVPISEIAFPYDNFTRIVHNASNEGRVTVTSGDYAKESILPDDFVALENGRLVDRQGQEYAYYHFITEKRRHYFRYPKWKVVPSELVIDITGFYTKDSFRNRRIIGMWRKGRSIPLFIGSLLKKVYRRKQAQLTL